MTSEPVLSPRALNRATLQRQLLLEPSKLSVTAAVEHLVGLQHQAPNAPYFALRARLAHFDAQALTSLMQQRKLVRCAMMRSTLHLVSARDVLALRPTLQAVQKRGLLASRGRDLKELDLDAVAEAGNQLLCAKPLNSNQLGKALAERWPARDATSLAMAVRALHALVHVPPAGSWNSFQNAVLLPAPAWLGNPMTTDDAPDKMVLRYLAAFGPATGPDITTWSGLTGVAETLALLGPRLRRYRDEQGRVLHDLKRATLPDPDTPAPVRLLGEFDNLVLSHADRSRLMDDARRPHIVTFNGQVRSLVLIDGRVQGTWKIARPKAGAELAIEPFRKLSTAEREAVTAEANAVLDFAAADTPRRTVSFAKPS